MILYWVDSKHLFWILNATILKEFRFGQSTDSTNQIIRWRISLNLTSKCLKSYDWCIVEATTKAFRNIVDSRNRRKLQKICILIKNSVQAFCRQTFYRECKYWRHQNQDVSSTESNWFCTFSFISCAKCNWIDSHKLSHTFSMPIK